MDKFERLVAYTKQIGVDDATLAELTKEELPEDFELESYLKPHVESYIDTKRKIHFNEISTSEGFLKKEDVDKQFNIFKGSVAQKVNKKFDLGFTRSQIEEKGVEFDALLSKVEETYNQKLEEAMKANDPELVEKLNASQKANVDLTEKLGGIEESYSTKIQRLQQEHQKDLHRLTIQNVWNDEIRGREIGREKIVADALLKQIWSDINEVYDIQPDKSLKGKNGLNALSFDGKKVYSSLSEAIDYKWDEYGMGRKAFGKTDSEDGKDVITPSGRYNEGNMSPAAIALKRRMEGGK